MNFILSMTNSLSDLFEKSSQLLDGRNKGGFCDRFPKRKAITEGVN